MSAPFLPPPPTHTSRPQPAFVRLYARERALRTPRMPSSADADALPRGQ